MLVEVEAEDTAQRGVTDGDVSVKKEEMGFQTIEDLL